MLPACPIPVWTTRNQVSFVSASLVPHSAFAKIHFIALEPPSPLGKGDVTAQKELFRSLNRFTVQTSFTNPFYARVVFSPPSPPVGGCSNAARTGPSSFHPSASYGCFATALGVRVSASVPERAFYLGSPLIPQHHGARIHRAIMFWADFLGLSAVADNTPWGGMD